MKTTISESKKKMEGAIKSLNAELDKVRTGKATASVFDGVKVDYYGQPTPLKNIAGIATPEANQITIQPYDPTSLKAIEAAIIAANLGFNPNSDGNILRIIVPSLTEERRKEFVKQAGKAGENAKTAIRNVRRESNEQIKKMEKSKEISKDEMHDGLQEIQDLTDAFIKKVDQLVSEKEKDILTI
jgi:ribosome recycling factor